MALFTVAQDRILNETADNESVRMAGSLRSGASMDLAVLRSEASHLTDHFAGACQDLRYVARSVSRLRRMIAEPSPNATSRCRLTTPECNRL